jgi:hypothetical protein
VVGENRRAVGGAHAGDVSQVLDDHRKAGQQAALRYRLAHERIGVPARALEAQGRQRIDGRIDRRDSPLQRVEKVVRADLLPPQQVDDRAGVSAIEVGVAGHQPCLACVKAKAYRRVNPQPMPIRPHDHGQPGDD